MKAAIGVVAVAAAAAFVRQAPATEVYLAPLQISGNTVTAGAAVNISNSPGYDNQPAFLPDGSGVLFSSNRDPNQTDIYRYDLATRQVSQVTHTDENEYSPTIMPGDKTFSVVRGAEQQIWQFDLDGGNAQLAYAHTGLIGYHAWLSPTTLALYVLGSQGQPSTLQFADAATGKAEVIDRNIGRSILNRSGRGTVSYVAMAEKPPVIKEFDPKTRKTATLVATLDGQEFCAWLPDGGLLTGQKAKLFLWRPGAAGWTEIADLSTAKITSITRLAVSRDGRWLAIVALPQPQ